MVKNEDFNFRPLTLAILLLAILQVNGQKYPIDTSTESDSILHVNFHFPENWKNKTSREMLLPVKIYKTSHKKPSSPILWLSGGPGQTNLDYVPPPELLKNHDVILIGYRGVDGLTSLDCPEVGNAFKGKGSYLLAQESIDNIKDAAKKCADRLRSEGVDLNGYTIEQVLSDIDSVRRSFQIKQFNLLSASYGTRVAQAYSKYHQGEVKRSVMIGANSSGRFVWEPEIIEEKIDDYNELCQKDPFCRKKTKSLKKTFEKVLNELPERWLFMPIDRGKVEVVTFGLLYNKKTALQVIDSFIAAEEGDYSGMALMSMAYNYIMPEMMVWGDFFSKGMIDYDHTRNYRKEFTSSPFVLGSPMSALFMDVGEIWPVKQPPQSFSNLDTTNVETLFLNGALDFSTPHEIVENELLPFFKKGKLIVFEGAGHVPDLLYKQEVVKGLEKYFLAGESQFKQFSKSISFEIDNGFPKIAKILVVVIAVVVLLLTFLLYRLIIRRMVNRRK